MVGGLDPGWYKWLTKVKWRLRLQVRQYNRICISMVVVFTLGLKVSALRLKDREDLVVCDMALDGARS